MCRIYQSQIKKETKQKRLEKNIYNLLMSHLLTSRNCTVPDSPNSETDVYAASG